MSTRASGYARLEHDRYVTPSWCYDLLLAVERFDVAMDPAPADQTFDFLQQVIWRGDVLTNPPFKLAERFCRHALELTAPYRGKVGLLLPAEFDYARGRNDLFRHPAFKKKLVMLRRIRWLNLPQKESGPSSNHSRARSYLASPAGRRCRPRGCRRSSCPIRSRSCTSSPTTVRPALRQLTPLRKHMRARGGGGCIRFPPAGYGDWNDVVCERGKK